MGRLCPSCQRYYVGVNPKYPPRGACAWCGYPVADIGFCAEKQRLEPYLYKGWRVHHYVEGHEQFIACQEAAVLRALTKEDIEAQIDQEVKDER